MAGYTYKHLSADDKAAIADQHRPDTPDTPIVDDALRAAWEADMYAHSVLAEQAADPDEKQEHLDAMATIEKALQKPVVPPPPNA